MCKQKKKFTPNRKFARYAGINIKPRIPMQTGDGVLQYSIRTRVQLDYHFLSTRYRNPRYSIGTRTRRSMYSVLSQKKHQVHKYIWISLEVINKMNFR